MGMNVKEWKEWVQSSPQCCGPCGLAHNIDNLAVDCEGNRYCSKCFYEKVNGEELHAGWVTRNKETGAITIKVIKEKYGKDES